MIREEIDESLLIDEICRITHFRKDDSTLFNFALIAVRSRSQELGISIVEYLNFIKKNPDEYSLFLNQVTIHKTGWFREKSHFELLTKHLQQGDYRHRLLRVLVGACSTGEEAYTLSLVLTELKQNGTIRDFTITGFDIDPVSVSKAVAGVYPQAQASFIPERYHSQLLWGEGEFAGFFTLESDIKSPCQFLSLNLLNLDQLMGQFDLIMIRNVFIYFDDRTISKISHLIQEKLSDKGVFIAGVSEKHDLFAKLFDNPASTLYQKKTEAKVVTVRSQKKKILILDDSKVIHSKIIKLTQTLPFEFVSAYSPQEASALLKTQTVDLALVDVNMPTGNGIDWLLSQRQSGWETPAFIFSDLAHEEILRLASAQDSELIDFISKEMLADKPQEFIAVLTECLQQHRLDEKKDISQLQLTTPDFILIGASTGGIAALHQSLAGLDVDCPPLLIVQHLDARFTEEFCVGIEHVSRLKRGELGAKLKPGHFYISKDQEHLELKKIKQDFLAFQNPHPPAYVTHKPSVDQLFRSAIPYAKKAWAVILTGMGDDGAQAMLELKKSGALTLTQDHQTSLVYGMPKQAKKLGASIADVTPAELNTLLKQLSRAQKKEKSA